MKEFYEKISKKERYFMLYTITFALVSMLVFSWQLFTERTFIYKSDGWTQHYKALYYYSRYLKDIIRSILYDHKVSLPEWEFAIGEGGDILGTLHYYVIGDPFAALSVFVPQRFLHIFFDVMILARLYLSGIAFSCLCIYKKQENTYALLAGAVTYVFCYWNVLNAARHPYFLNPMIYMPLVILGIEKVLNKERPYLLSSAVMFSAFSNFYFFYMIVIMAVIYTAVRLILLHGKNIRAIVADVVRIGIFSVIGVLLAAVIFFPVVYTFLADSRNDVDNAVHLFYPLSYYSGLPGRFISMGDNYWLCMGYSGLALPSVMLLFMKKEKRILKVLFLAALFIICFPVCGWVLNGFSYVSNRWSWAMALLTAYIVVRMWPQLMRLQLKEACRLFVFLTIYLLLCVLLDYSRSGNAFFSLAVVFATFAVLLPVSGPGMMLSVQRKQQLVFLLLTASVAGIGFYKYAPTEGNYSAETTEADNYREDFLYNETLAVKQVADGDDSGELFRYSGRNLTANAGLSAGLSSTGFYWSLSNPSVADFRTQMELPENTLFNYKNYDDRTILTTLAGVRYYVTPADDKAPAPYGFHYADTIDVKAEIMDQYFIAMMAESGEWPTDEQMKILRKALKSEYNVYRNDDYLPLLYTYGKYITEDTYNALPAVAKQEALLQAVVLSDKPEDAEEAELSFLTVDVPYTVECGDGLVMTDENTVVTMGGNKTITLTFEGLDCAETYVKVGGGMV